MGRIFSICVYLFTLLGFVNITAADTPSTQPAAAPTTPPPPTNPPPGPGPESGQPGVYWTPRQQPPPQYAPYAQGPAYYPANESLFPAGHFELNLGGQGYTVWRHGGTDTIGFITFDGLYYFVNGLGVGFEAGVAPGDWDDDHHHDGHHRDDGVRAADIMALLRWHFLSGHYLSPYAEVGLGDLYADHGFPGGGRRDNFLATVGLGLSWRVVDHLYLAGGARYARLGDWDDRHGHGSGHGSDGIQYYGGISFVP